MGAAAASTGLALAGCAGLEAGAWTVRDTVTGGYEACRVAGIACLSMAAEPTETKREATSAINIFLICYLVIKL